MSLPHASPGEIVDVRPLGPALAATVTRTLVKTGAMEVRTCRRSAVLFSGFLVASMYVLN